MRATSSFVVARTRADLSSELASIRGLGRTVALVPTMGSLHPGHLSLIERARALADETVVSIFVNRLQFGAGEDFEAYPRDLEKDLELSAQRGVRLVFAPKEEVLYPLGEPRIRIDPGAGGDQLCGAFRPGHFQGVLTVVAKLFGLIRPDLAVFGRKDFQQSVLIRHMVEDLDLSVHIEVAPLVREADGLAISSRNAYLQPEERQEAVGVFQALSVGAERFRGGERRASVLLREVKEAFAMYPRLRVQYVECVDPDALVPIENARTGAVLAAAVFCGGTRLIDNVVLGQDYADPRVPADAWRDPSP